MIAERDKNNSNSIDFEEFLDMMTSKMNERESKEDLSKVFRLFDDNNTGTITVGDLKKIAYDLQEDASEEELAQMVEIADSNGDGAVTMEDFFRLFMNRTM